MKDAIPRRDEQQRIEATTDGPSTGGPTRRRYLQAATTIGVLGAAGLSATPVQAETFADKLAGYADRFDTIIDVTEAGADNTGTQSITHLLRKLAADDTLLVFPPGTYYMDAQFRFTGFSNFGLLGNDATIVPAPVEDFVGPRYRLFRLGVPYNPGRDVLVEGFTIDQTADDTGMRVVETMVHDGLEVRDITIDGQHDSGTFGPGLFSVVDPDGSGVVERFEAPDGGAWVSDTPDPLGLWRGPTGILLSKYHKGFLELRDCVLGGFPDNGLYGVTDGTVHVIGGHYENSNAASIRLAGTDCLVQNVTVTVDENPAHFVNQRAIRLDEGSGFLVDNVTIDLVEPNGHAITVKNDVASARIQDTDVTIGDRVNHGIVVSPEAGTVDIVRSNVKIDGGGNAIRIEGADAGKVVVSQTDVWGKASGGTFRHAIRCDRNGVELRGVKVWQPGPDYRRGVVMNGDDCLLYNSVVKARHHPVWVNGDGAWIEASYLESYDDFEAIRLNDSSSNATIKDNTLVDGILDKGCAGLQVYGNTYQ